MSAATEEYDAFGRLVPQYVREAFAGRRRMMQSLSQLDKIRSQIAALSREPFCRHIEVSQVLAHLEEAKALVIRGLPYVICNCRAEQLDCKKCEGQRWVTAGKGPIRLPAWRV